MSPLLLILFYLPVALCSYGDLVQLNGQSKRIIYLLLCILILSFSLSLVEMSGDFVNYALYFDHLPSFGDYFSGSLEEIARRYEPGFALYAILVRTLTTDPVVALSLITVIGVAGILWQLPRYTTAVFLALSVYIAHFYWWNGIVLLRQVCAVILLFPLLRLIPAGNYLKAVMYILAASLFHFSALAFLFVLPFLRMDIRKRFLFLYVVVFFVIGYFDLLRSSLFPLIAMLPRGDVFVNYFGSPERALNPLYYAEMVLVLSCGLYFRDKLVAVNPYAAIAIRYLVVAVLVAGLFQRYEIASRLSTYFLFYGYIILIPAFAGVMKQTIANRLLYYTLVNTYLFLFFARFVILTVQ